MDQAKPNIDKHLRFVNDQREFHETAAQIYSDNPKRQQRHLKTATLFTELAQFVSELVAQAASREQPSDQPEKTTQIRLTLTRAELEGLPQELLEELSTSGTDPTGYAILDMMEARGGIMSLDQILVGLYREFLEVHKRQTVTSRLYRMAQRNLIFNVPGKKGVYSTRPLDNEQMALLLGEGPDQGFGET